MIKWLGHVLVSCAFWLGGIEIVRLMESRNMALLSLQEVWQGLNKGGYDAFQHLISTGYFPGLWPDVIVPFMMLPLLFILLATGLLFEFMAFKWARGR